MQTLSREDLLAQEDPEITRQRIEARRNMTLEARVAMMARSFDGMTQEKRDMFVKRIIEHLRKDEEEKKARRHLTEPQS
jgi:hypothetical protein